MLNYHLVADYEVEGVPSATYKECIEFIKNNKTISVDIETTRKFGGTISTEEGLDPYLSNIVMLQIGTEDIQYVIDARVIDCKEIVKMLALRLLIGQNLKFEYKHFLVNYGVRLLDIYDTMIAEAIITNGTYASVSLGEMNKKYLDITVNKGIRLEFLTIGSKPFTPDQIKYGAEDVLYPIWIRRCQHKLLEEMGALSCARLEARTVLVYGDIETKGLHFNKDQWLDTYEKASMKKDKLQMELDAYLINNFPEKYKEKQIDIFSDDVVCTMSWSSSKQVIELFQMLDACPMAESKSTKSMRPTVEAKELSTVLAREDLPENTRWLINTYLEFKQAEQATTTFGEQFLKYVNPVTGRLHSSYRQMVSTGRSSSNNPIKLGVMSVRV